MSKKTLFKVLKDSERIKINGKTKIAILSDIHRGDGGIADSFLANKNIFKAALNYYYKNNYILIENGDGDELWKNNNFVDISYNYNDIFKIYNKFKNKNNLYMIFGNHDYIKKRSDFIDIQKSKMRKIYNGFGGEFLKLVDDFKFREGIVLKYENFSKEILITHGHQLDFFNCEMAPISRILVKYLWRPLEGIGGFKSPVSPANNYKKGGVIDDELESFAKKYNIVLICGHTHRSVFLNSKKACYFNDGCCVLPDAISVIEIKDAKISLIKWSYEVRDDNGVYIVKTVVGNAEYLENFCK